MILKEYKVIINLILVRLGIRKILPSKIINRVTIIDNNEPLELVDIDKYHISLAPRISAPIYLRKTVKEKIYLLSEELEKENLYIKLYDAYRTLEDQQNSWDIRLSQTKEEHPDITDEKELERLNKKKVSKADDTENIGGHLTGGAVDISLVDKDGNELDFGTKYEEYNEKTLTYAKNISKEAKANRKKLLSHMKKLDFVNFPGEWWHFCYGDNMWSAYKNKKTAIYGYIDLDNYK